MPAGYTNLKIESGANFSITIELDNADGTHLNLTGTTGACKIRKSYYSSLYVYPLTVGIEDPATLGKINLTATAVETALMEPGRYVYDIELTTGSVTDRIMEGIAEVKPNATKPQYV